MTKTNQTHVYRITVANVTPERLSALAALYWPAGGTVFPHVGYWTDPESGRVVREKGATLEVAGEPLTGLSRPHFLPHTPIASILRALKERSAYVTVDGHTPCLFNADGSVVPL